MSYFFIQSLMFIFMGKFGFFYLSQGLWQSGSTVVIHVLFEVHVEVFEDKVQLLVAVDHIQKLDNVAMIQLFQQGDLTNGSAWDTFGFPVKKIERYIELFYCCETHFSDSV